MSQFRLLSVESAQAEGCELVREVLHDGDDFEAALSHFDRVPGARAVLDHHVEGGPNQRADIVGSQADLCSVNPARPAAFDVAWDRVEQPRACDGRRADGEQPVIGRRHDRNLRADDFADLQRRGLEDDGGLNLRDGRSTVGRCVSALRAG